MKRAFAGLLLVALALLVVLLTAWSVGAADAAASQTYRAHGITFQFPDRWVELRPGATSAESGAQLWSDWLGPSRSNSVDLVVMAGYALPFTVTAATVAAARPAIAAGVRQLVTQSGGRILRGPTPMRLGGFPGYRFLVRTRAAGGRWVESRLFLVFRARSEYFLNCQYAVGGRRAAEINAGCDRIVASFRAR